MRGLEGGIHKDYEAGKIALLDVRNRKMTGREFLFKLCDEKFWSDDLNDVGNQFAKWYYEDNKEGRPTYFDDYAQVFAKDVPGGDTYYLKDTWENYERIAAVIDQRFTEWQSGAKPGPLNKSPASTR
jgi:hypothetical protein